jgi:hypothetical protein
MLVLVSNACPRNCLCDFCRGPIGGVRLFCLDCANKDTELHNPLDICGDPQCISQRITRRQDLESPHEPNHKLVKVRTTVLKRQYGRVYTAARKAFERVEGLCKKIAEFSEQSQETRSDTGGPDTTIALSVGVTSQKPGDEALQDTTQGPGSSSQPKVSDLPTCGKCKGHLSFPCWYCIVCEGQSQRCDLLTKILTCHPALSDNPFICNTCDADGVPDLVLGSEKHNEYHHLIRCLAPEKCQEAVLSTEQRLGSIEDRLNCMQSRFDDLNGGFEDHNERFDDLKGRFGDLNGRFDDLNGRFDDLNNRFENIEQLLHRLVGTAGSAAA